jgi:phage gp29-like protein
MLLDYRGNPIKARPDTREIAAVSLRDKYSAYPSRGLTPEKLARILREADGGDLYRQMELFEEIEEKDTHLMSVMGTRKNAVLGAEYEVLPWSDDAADKEVAAFVSDAIFSLEDFDDTLLTLLDAIGKGFAVSEIMWEIRGGKALPMELKWRHQKKFCYDDFERLRVLTDANPWPGELLPDNKFIVHRYSARSGYKSRAGIYRTCVWMYLFKNYTLKDWVAFAEVYGMPIRLGKYEPSASKEEQDKLTEAVARIGTDAAGIISKSTEIQFIEAAKADGKVFEALAKFCNAEISKAVLGQTQTSEIAASGSLASAKVHEEVRQDILDADARALAKTIRQGLIRPLVLFNFGEDAARRLPSIKFSTEKAEDQEKTAKVYMALSSMGLPITTAHLYEKFGVPSPEAGDELLQRPAGPMPDPFASSSQEFHLGEILSGLSAQANSLRVNAAMSKDGQVQNAPPSPAKQVHPFEDERTAGILPKPFRPAQAQLEKLADKSIVDAAPVMDELVKPILALAQKAGSLEELKDGLLKIYPKLDTGALEELTARALFIADLCGRAEAGDEGGP